MVWKFKCSRLVDKGWGKDVWAVSGAFMLGSWLVWLFCVRGALIVIDNATHNGSPLIQHLDTDLLSNPTSLSHVHPPGAPKLILPTLQSMAQAVQMWWLPFT